MFLARGGGGVFIRHHSVSSPSFSVSSGKPLGIYFSSRNSSSSEGSRLVGLCIYSSGLLGFSSKKPMCLANIFSASILLCIFTCSCWLPPFLFFDFEIWTLEMALRLFCPTIRRPGPSSCGSTKSLMSEKAMVNSSCFSFSYTALFLFRCSPRNWAIKAFITGYCSNRQPVEAALDGV